MGIYISCFRRTWISNIERCNSWWMDQMNLLTCLFCKLAVFCCFFLMQIIDPILKATSIWYSLSRVISCGIRYNIPTTAYHLLPEPNSSWCIGSVNMLLQIWLANPWECRYMSPQSRFVSPFNGGFLCSNHLLTGMTLQVTVPHGAPGASHSPSVFFSASWEA